MPRISLAPLSAALALALVALVTACDTTPPRSTTAPSAAPSAAPAPAPAPATVASTQAEILAAVPAISAAALEPRLATPDAPVVLDVRTPEEYAAGHLPGARLLPHDQLPQRLAELAASKDQEVVVYCRSGRRAALAIDTLKRAGFSRVGHLQGDYQAWSTEGRKVVVEQSSPVPPAKP